MADAKAWIRQTLAHEQPDAVPYNFMFSPPVQGMLERHYAPPLEDVLDFPLRMTGAASIKPLYAPPAQFGTSAIDEFGVVWSTSDIDRGQPLNQVLPEPDLAHYRFPDPASDHRFEALAAWCEWNRHGYTIIWVGDLWERATFMRGMEPLLLDLALSPEFVRGLLRRLGDYVLETMAILFNTLEFDGVAVSDDYGAQSGMLMSPEHWRRFVKPVLREVYGLARKHGRTVFHHSCGHITPIVPDLIEIGLDILHPIQPEAMDIHALKREFGHDLTFCGGLRTQDLLPRGTPDEIRREVRKLKRTMGDGGGYILEPGITVQADVPLPNIVAAIDEARCPGWTGQRSRGGR